LVLGGRLAMPVAKRRRLEAPSGAVAPASSREMALHEVVGWLLGAVLAAHDPGAVDDVPALLAKHRRAELELLRATLLEHVSPGLGAPGDAQRLAELAPLAELAAYRELLRGLHAYCAAGGGCAEVPEWPPGVSSAWLLNAFFSQVLDVVERRCRFHASGRGAKPSSRERTASSRPTQSRPHLRWPRRQAGRGSDAYCEVRQSHAGMQPKGVQPHGGAEAECGNGVVGLPVHHTAAGSKGACGAKVTSAQEPAAAQVPSRVNARAASDEEPEEEPQGGLAQGAKVASLPGLDCATPSPSRSGQRELSEDEEWPDGNGACEGCGRFTYGCEAWSKACVILCGHCRKARSPMMWALASEAFRLHSAGMGGA